MSDEEWEEVGEELTIVIDNSDEYGDSDSERDLDVPDKKKKQKGLPSITAARRVAKWRRSELRRTLLTQARNEHCFYLLCCLSYLRSLSEKWQCKHVNPSVVKLPSHPHHLPTLPPVTAFSVNELPQSKRVKVAVKDAFAKKLQSEFHKADQREVHVILHSAGYIVRPVVGVSMDTSWTSSLRKVGRYLDAAADRAILGKPEQPTYAPTPDKKTVVKKERKKRARKAKKAKDAESDLFSFESSEDENEYIEVSVDAMLDAEEKTKDVENEADATASTPWDPDFLGHTPRNPVKAVNKAADEETAYYAKRPVQHFLEIKSWCEVLSPEGYWMGVDTPSSVSGYSYVFTYLDGHVLDVTPKYAFDYNITLTKRLETIDIPKEADEGMWERHQVDDGSDGESHVHPERLWLAQTLKKINDSVTPAHVEVEKELIRRMKYKKPPTGFHKDLVKHNLFCAKTLLTKLEGLHPDAVPFKKEHQYEIYVREDVTKLRGRDAWRRMGRQVKRNERGVRRVQVTGWQKTTESGGKKMKDIFGWWQTEVYEAEVETKDGRISSDTRTDGTVSLVDGPLPKNLAHVTGFRVAQMCAYYFIPYAKALVGFTRLGGFSRPNFDGVAVPKEYEVALRIAVFDNEMKHKVTAREKKSGALIKKWETLVRHLITRQAMREAYA